MNSMLTDDELAEGFKLGRQEYFEELVYRYKNSLYQYIMVMVHDEGAAGDLFQEVFIGFFKNADKYHSEGKFKAWLFRSARNRVLNFFRDRDKLYSLDAPDENGNNVLQETLSDDEPLPQEQLENAELGRRLRGASLRLPDKQREVVYLRQYLTFKEIAQLLERPLGSVLSDFSRGVKKMQALLLAENNNEVNYDAVR